MHTHQQVQAHVRGPDEASVQNTCVQVRLNVSLLAAAACHLAESSSGSHSSAYPPLEWPLTEACVSQLPADSLHYQVRAHVGMRVQYVFTRACMFVCTYVCMYA